MNRRRVRTPLLLGAVCGLGAVAACGDLGEDPLLRTPPPAGPVISDLAPRRTVVADTVRIEGSAFGSSQGTSEVLFTSVLRTASGVVLSWSDEEITVLVPETAVDGPIRLRIGGSESNGFAFSVAASLASYTGDLFPIFEAHGCLICHSIEFGAVLSGGFGVYPRETLLSTGDPPGVVPRKSHASEIIHRLTIPLGQVGHMPEFGSFYEDLTAPEIERVSDWIDQGARDN